MMLQIWCSSVDSNQNHGYLICICEPDKNALFKHEAAHTAPEQSSGIKHLSHLQGLPHLCVATKQVGL